jgi:hypothetical protein
VAVDDDDDRLALQGLDRVRTSLEQLLKVHGLLLPDSGATFIDARRQQVAILGELTKEQILALAGLCTKTPSLQLNPGETARLVGP